jgi:hypothetical protein
LNLIIPTADVAIIHSPAKEAYVTPTGTVFMTLESAYIHKIIVIELAILGNHCVNPSALFAKLFEAVPKIIAKNKNMYGLLMLI